MPLPRSVVVVESVTLATTSVLLALGGKTSSLSSLVDSVGDPVDSGVSSDGLVGGADKEEARMRGGSGVSNTTNQRALIRHSGRSSNRHPQVERSDRLTQRG